MNSDDKKESFKVGDIPEKFKDQPDVLGSWTHLEYSRTFAFGKKDNGLFVIISSGKDGMALTPSWKESKLLVDGKTYDVVLSKIPGKKKSKKAGTTIAPGTERLYWVKPKDDRLSLLNGEYSLLLQITDEEDTKAYAFIFKR